MREWEPDPDLVREAIEELLDRARARERRVAWDEPPGFYDPDPIPPLT